MALERAARVGDPVEHSHRFMGGVIGFGLGALAGIAIGVALVAAAPVTLAAAGLIGGAMIVAGAASTGIGVTLVGEALGENVGAHVAAPNAGDIADGAHTVFTGPGQPRAARMSDPVKCHSGQTIAEGSKTVFIENWNASRKGDATMCAGKIQDGCPSVLIGGDPIGRHGSADRSEVPWWWHDGMIGLGWLGTGLGFINGQGEVKTGVALALQGTGAAVTAYSQSGLPGAKAVGLVGGAAVTTGKILTGNPTAISNISNSISVVGQGNNAANFVGGSAPPETY